MIEHIPELVQAGVDSFKIEGRMKTALYVAVVARTYSQALSDYMESEELYKSRIPYYKEEIAKCTYRQFTTGFFFGKPTHETQIYDSNTYPKEYNYLGLIDEVDDQGKSAFSQKNKFMTGDTIELMVPSGENRQAKCSACGISMGKRRTVVLTREKQLRWNWTQRQRLTGS